MADTTTPSVAPSKEEEDSIMNASQVAKSDVIELGARNDVERARERVLEEARALGERMTRLIASIESEPVDAHPPTTVGAVRHAAELERLLVEWTQAKQTLRTVRHLRRALEPEEQATLPS
jgi:hypothetical protein